MDLIKQGHCIFNLLLRIAGSGFSAVNLLLSNCLDVLAETIDLSSLRLSLSTEEVSIFIVSGPGEVSLDQSKFVFSSL